MNKGGKAWRGYFPIKGEQTSGKPDMKEGIYFGKELPPSEIPLHGQNLFPADNPEFREIILEYMQVMKNLGDKLMQGVSISLGLSDNYFADRFTSDPTILFRIFHYPPMPADSLLASGERTMWSVGEHSDYGILTILKQDDTGGLQVKNRDNVWVDAPPLDNTFVINIGDMLEKMTGGFYRSTPHRVLNPQNKNRISFPFFYDPSWAAKITRIKFTISDQEKSSESENTRWDGLHLNILDVPTYGDFLIHKVLKCFPALGKTTQIKTAVT
eukprot:TRINITY_DN20579_c0_g1_i1.p1 TRINITY_DN20579_c0_g1~~TRINITY_DN20579_c0_g1_i1.p1  ORF type:complete len:270 (-),score=40.61 TRINITY_DN20579_c0_g1_i1:317-1126(-)